MKKTKNIISKIFIVICMFFIIFSTSAVKAAEGSGHGGGSYTRSSETASSSSSTTGISSELKPEDYSPKSGQIDSEVVQSYASKFFSFLYVAAVLITIIVIMYVGLKYVTGSITEKAEYKKNLIPIAIGALLISFLATVIKIIYSISNSI